MTENTNTNNPLAVYNRHSSGVGSGFISRRYFSELGFGLTDGETPIFSPFVKYPESDVLAKGGSLHVSIEQRADHTAALVSLDRTIEGLVRPRGIAFHPSTGECYMVEQSTSALYKINSHTGVVIERIGDAIQFGLSLTSPRDLSFSPGGDLYMTSSGNLYRLDLITGVAILVIEGKTTSVTDIMVRFVNGISFNSAGVLYFNNLLSSGLSSIDLTLSPPYEVNHHNNGDDYGISDFTPISLTFDSNDILYMVGSRHFIYMVDLITSRATQVSLLAGYGVGEINGSYISYGGDVLYLTGEVHKSLYTINMNSTFAIRVDESIVNFGYQLQYNPRNLDYIKSDGTLRTVKLGVMSIDGEEILTASEFTVDFITTIDEIFFLTSLDNDYVSDDFENDVLAADKGLLLLVLGGGNMQRISIESDGYVFRQQELGGNYKRHNQLITNLHSVALFEEIRHGVKTQFIYAVEGQQMDLNVDIPENWLLEAPASVNQIIYIDVLFDSETGHIVRASDIKNYESEVNIPMRSSSFSQSFSNDFGNGIAA